MVSSSRCSCLSKLTELQESVRNELHPCKEEIYQSRISHLQGEIDTLQLRNDDLRAQLADINATISSDPFLSCKFQQSATRFSDAASAVYGININNNGNFNDVYRQLCLLSDRNRELEGRLSSEQAISMSWKHKVHNLEKKLNAQLEELIALTKDVSCVGETKFADVRSEKREVLTKDAVNLLKLARIRIESDKTRIESLTNRIAELERKVLENRLNNSEATNQTNDYIQLSRPSEGRYATRTGGSLSHQPLADTMTYQDDLTIETNCLVNLGLPRHLLKGVPGKYNGDPHINTELETSLKKQQTQLDDSTERRKLIELYSDILRLIKKNKEPMPKLDLHHNADTVIRGHGSAGSRTKQGHRDKRSQKSLETYNETFNHESDKKLAMNKDKSKQQDGGNGSIEIAKADITADKASKSKKKVKGSSKNDTTVQTSDRQVKEEPKSSCNIEQVDEKQMSPLKIKSASVKANVALDQPSQDESINERDLYLEPQVLNVADQYLDNSCSNVRSDPNSLESDSSVDQMEPQSQQVQEDLNKDTPSFHSNEDPIHIYLETNLIKSPTPRSSLDSIGTDMKEEAEYVLDPSYNGSVPSDLHSIISENDSSYNNLGEINNSSSQPEPQADVSKTEGSLPKSPVGCDSILEPKSEDPILREISTNDILGHCDESNIENVNDSDASSPDSSIKDASTTTTNRTEQSEKEPSHRNQLVLQIDAHAMNEQKMQMMNDLLILLENVPVLKDLPQDRLRHLLRYFKFQSYSPNAAIILAGEKPQSFYVLASGMVSAYSYEGFDKPNRLLRRYLNADYFGEMSLINNIPYPAYIIADGHVTVQAMAVEDFLEQLSDVFPNFQRRAQEEYGCKLEEPPIERINSISNKAVDAFTDIVPFMSEVPIVSMVPDLELFARKLQYQNFSKKEVIVNNMNSVKEFCIIYRGKISMYCTDVDFSICRDIAVLGPKSFIGGFSYNDPKVKEIMESASLVATEDGTLLKMDYKAFKDHLKGMTKHFQEYMEQFFLDKLNELNLLEEVEQTTGRLSEESNSSRRAEELYLDSDAAHDEITPRSEQLSSSSVTVTPMASSTVKSSDYDLDLVKEETASEASISDSRSFISDAEEDRGGVISSMSSSFGGSEYSINSSVSDEESHMTDNPDLDSFRTETSDDITEDSGKFYASNGFKQPSLDSFGDHKDSETSDQEEVKVAPNNVTRRTRRVQTGIYKGPLELNSGDITDCKTVSSAADSSSWSESSDLATDDDSVSSPLGEERVLSDLDDDLSDYDVGDSFSDSSKSSRTYDEDAIKASKKLLLATLKCKCNSLAAAFNFMDPEKCGLVLRPRFYECMEELCIASIEAGELPYLFDLMKEPGRDVMTLASLYRSSGETIENISDLHLRLKEVYGSALAAFEKQFGSLRKNTTCSETDFVIMLDLVGISEDEAKALFKELDICNMGYVTVMTMIKLMRHDWTREEAIEKETAAVSSYNQILGYLQHENHQEFRKEFSNHYMCVFDILEYGCNVSMVDSSLEEVKLPNKDCKSLRRYVNKVILPAIESEEYFKMLSVIQRGFVASLFTSSTHEGGSVVIKEGDEDYPIYLVLKGNIKSSYSTYLYNEFGLTDVGEGSWLALESFIQGNPSVYTYKVGEEDCLLGRIDRSIFKDTVMPMVEIREKRVPVLISFLRKVPCLENLYPADIERIARTSVVRKYKMHETIFKTKDPADWMYIVFDGCVSLRFPGFKDQADISVETTGMLGVEDICHKLETYQSTALANSSVVYLIGWPVSKFYDVFGVAVDCVCKASQLDVINRDSIRQKIGKKSPDALQKKKKSVSFSMKKSVK